jgi:hypothetical protein
MQSRLLALALVSASLGSASCTLLLEPIAHRPYDGSSADAARRDARHRDAVDTAADDDAFDATDSDLVDAVDAHDGHSTVDVSDGAHGDAIAVDVVAVVDVAPLEGGRTDAGTDDVVVVTRDAVAVDATPDPDAGGGSVPCSSDGDCVPYWCGCGACPSADAFTCENPSTSCPLLCPMEFCPYTQNVSCACVGGFCQRSIGTTPEGSSCASSAECAPGLSCCACGASGCASTCTAVDPRFGCPLVM